MNASLQHAIAEAILEATGEPFIDFKFVPAGGGCINQTFRLQLGPRCYFLKLNASAPLAMFEAERDALQTLAASRSIRVPRPLAAGMDGGTSFLLLEYLPLRPGRPGDYAKLGEQLAELHRHSSPHGQHGWVQDNFIGSSPQSNPWQRDWTAFWREARLKPQLCLASEDNQHYKNAECVMENLGVLLTGHHPAPSLLHGDLWSGNIAFTEGAGPVIYDPASYYGDRETDLAMTRLFGSLPTVFYDAYHATYPLPDGHEARQNFYNLYHILNHAHLFGGHYPAQAQVMIDALVRQI